MKQVINQNVSSLVLQIVGALDENQWIVSAGHDSERTELNFVATIRPAVLAQAPDLKRGDFIRATITTAQYLDGDGALSARAAISAVTGVA